MDEFNAADGTVEKADEFREERIYMDALRTNYRLENWHDEDLASYCGIYDRKGIA